MSRYDPDRHLSPQSIWKEQNMTATTLTPHVLDSRARDFEARLRRRNRFEHIAGGVVALFGLGTGIGLWLNGTATLANHMLAAGLMLLAGAAVFVGVMLHRRAAPRSIDGSRPTRDSYREELVRQRDALGSVWLWYVGPFVPAFVLIYGSNLLREGSQWLPAGLLMATLIFMGIVIRVNRSAAVELDREISSLDRL